MLLLFEVTGPVLRTIKVSKHAFCEQIYFVLKNVWRLTRETVKKIKCNELLALQDSCISKNNDVFHGIMKTRLFKYIENFTFKN